MQIGLDNGGISPFAYDPTTKLQTGGYITEAPLASDVTTNDKALRYLQGMKFTAWLAGAIHNVKIEGVLTL